MRSAGAPRDRPAGRLPRGNGPGSLPQLEEIKGPLKDNLFLTFPLFLGQRLLFCCCGNRETLDSFPLLSRSRLYDTGRTHSQIWSFMFSSRTATLVRN